MSRWQRTKQHRPDILPPRPHPSSGSAPGDVPRQLESHFRIPVIPIRLLLSLRKSHDRRAESERVEKSTQVMFLYVTECRARKVLAVPNAEKQQAVAFPEHVLFILEEEPLWFGAIALQKMFCSKPSVVQLQNANADGPTGSSVLHKSVVKHNRMRSAVLFKRGSISACPYRCYPSSDAPKSIMTSFILSPIGQKGPRRSLPVCPLSGVY